MTQADGVLCAACGRQNPAGRMFCDACRSLLSNKETYHTAPRKKINWKRLRLIWYGLFVVGLAVSYYLATQKPSDFHTLASSPEAAKRFSEKLQAMDQAVRKEEPYEFSASVEEINSFFRENMGLSGGQNAVAAEANLKALSQKADVEALDIVDTQVNLIDNRIQSSFVFRYKGKTFYLRMTGRPRIDTKGYFRFDTDSVKLGKLPVPAFAVRMAVDKALKDPAYERMLKMPDYLRAIWVEGGELKIRLR